MVATGTKSLRNGAVGESARGYAIMDAHPVAWFPLREYAYLHSDTLSAGDPAFRSAISDVKVRMATGLGGGVSVVTAPDRHAVLIGGIVRTYTPIDQFRGSILAAAPGHPAVTIEEAGQISAGAARDKVVSRDLSRAELLAVPVTFVVLLIAFGALVAALVPLVLGLTGVAAAFGLLGPISQAFPLDDSVKTVVLLIGMAVGVDYALFYVVRSREERHRGFSSHDALERT